MTIRWNGSKSQQFIFHNYYYFLVAVNTACMFLPVIRIGVTMALVILYQYLNISTGKRSDRLSSLTFVFLIYTLLSIQGYIYNGVPISAYIEDFTTQSSAMIFFFIAYSTKVDKEKFYRTYIIAIALAELIGFYYYLHPTAYYFQFISDHFTGDYEGQVNDPTKIARFQSLFGSTVTGSLSVILFVLSFYRWSSFKDDEKIIRIVWLAISVIAFAAAIMTNQRSAMVMIIVCLGAMALYLIRYKQKNIMPFILILIVVGMVLYPLLMGDLSDFLVEWLERLDSVGGAIGERDSQWTGVLYNSPNIILGAGLGSVGHHAIGSVGYHVPDGGLVKLLAEFGIIGFSIFIVIILQSFLKGIKFLMPLYREVLVVFVCVMQSIGSNILSFQQVVPLFWFCLGVIASYRRVKKYNIS